MTDSVGPWQLVDRVHRVSLFADQGLASVTTPDGGTRLVFRGDRSIPAELRRGGRWAHIGDPDACLGHVFDAYQGPGGSRSKLFRVTTPTGAHYDYLHDLVGDEQFNNSFAAVSPDGQWLVSGEWGEVSRLLVFPAPVLNRSVSSTGGALQRVADIRLDKPVRNVQGAAFLDATTLLCSTDDPGTDLWPTPRQLLSIELPAPLAGTPATGRVSSLGLIPMTSVCKGRFEVEGMDYDRER